MPDLTARQDQQENYLRRIYRGTINCMIMMYILGAVFYADPFHFRQHALSELGTTRTLLGTPNLASALFVTAGMFITGRLLLEAARVYRYNAFYSQRYLKSGFLCCASLGAFIAMVPNNLLHLVYTISSALLIGVVFLLILFMTCDSKVYHSPALVYLAMSILGGTVLVYAITFFSRLEIKQAVQKICLISLQFILYQRSRIQLNLSALEKNFPRSDHSHQHTYYSEI
jgi:hypothetical protein